MSPNQERVLVELAAQPEADSYDLAKALVRARRHAADLRSALDDAAQAALTLLETPATDAAMAERVAEALAKFPGRPSW